MATPERPDTHEVPSYSTECSSAEFACNARCQPGTCCQIAQERELGRHSIPDGDGRCQGSTSGSPYARCSATCLDRARGAFTFNARALKGSHSDTAEDACYSDCTPACRIPSGPNADREDNVVASAAECGCCSKGHSARGQSCSIPIGSTADGENNVAAANAEHDCFSECHTTRGQAYPADTGPVEKEDTVATSTVNTRASI